MARGGAGEGPYSFEFIAAPGDLQPCLNSFYFFTTSEARLEDALPAYSGQLLLVLEGSCTIVLADGSRVSADEAALLAPLTQAHQFEVTGPCTIFGASLNFRGWAAITGLEVDTNCDQLLPLEAGLRGDAPAKLRALVADWRGGSVAREALPALLSEVLREQSSELPERTAQAIDLTLDWLSSSLRPELDQLYDKFALSRRQVQRVVSRLFGQSPIHLARRYRAVRAATMLATPGLSDEVVGQIRDSFYDQAHMIKEIRHFTGRTPKHLDPRKGSPVNRSLDTDGYSAVDPFGGSEARQLGK